MIQGLRRSLSKCQPRTPLVLYEVLRLGPGPLSWRGPPARNILLTILLACYLRKPSHGKMWMPPGED